MSRIKIITDSTAYLPKEFVDRYQIDIIPLTVNWEGKIYLDGVDRSTDVLYYRLTVSSAELPTTNATSIHDYSTLIQAALDDDHEVLILPISSGISASYNNAVKAVEAFAGRPVEIIDTKLVSMALSFMVLAAARAAEAGATLAETKRAAQEAYNHIGVYFTVEDLKYLHKGGRIGTASRLLGSALSIKPILKIADGRIEAAGKEMTRRKALERMIYLVEEGVGNARPVRLSVFHALDIDTANYLMERCREKFQPDELILSEVSPVIGSHVGPGTVSIAWMAGM